MKKLLLLPALLATSCSPVYELYSRAGWVKIESREIIKTYGYPDVYRIHYTTDRNVSRYAEIPLQDSNLYIIGRRVLMLEGR